MENLKKRIVQAIREGDQELAKILAEKYSRIINIEVYGNQQKETDNMGFNPIVIASQLDEIAGEVEKAPNLTEAQRKYFAYRIDKVTDSFEKAATDHGFRTKNGEWLMGDTDESRYMGRFDQTGTIMGDEDEERYMKNFENSVGRESQSVSVHEEPPIRDLNTADNPKSTADWKNPWRNNNLTEGNKVARTIPKRKV